MRFVDCFPEFRFHDDYMMAGPIDSSSTGAGRYHAFDNMRGAMMMLLLALHSSISYMATPLGTVWPYKDGSTSMVFDITVVFIHTFRLPLFLIMAGFFGAKLLYQRGAREFAMNRLKRIAIPLAVFWVLLTPLILAPFALFCLEPGPRTFGDLVSWLMSADARSHLHFFHLWFLFDLLLYYVVMTLLVEGVELTGLSKREGLGRLFTSLWGVTILVAVTAISLSQTRLGIIETPGTFRRPLATLLANGVFFFFGWGLFSRRDLVGRLALRAWTWTSFGILCLFAHLWCVVLLLGGNRFVHIPSVIFATLSVWCLVCGIMGLFGRYGGDQCRIGRYLADSSYWCYLVHLPVIAWLSLVLGSWQVHAALKFTIVFIATVAICLLTYDRLVRSTPIGTVLCGRRHAK